MRGEAFGYVPPGPASVTPFAPDSRSDEFRRPYELVTSLGASLADVFHLRAHEVVVTAGLALGDWHMTLRGAQALLMSHAANDLRLLIGEVLDGEGRSAARTARSLFEHVVHLHYVELDPEHEERYYEHAAVTAQDLAGIQTGLDLLPTKTRKRQKARLNRLAGSTKERANKAIERWPKFRTRWSDRSLLHMAKLAGREKDYDVYRVLSAVTHGTAGGIYGLTHSVKGEIIHRFGADAELVPLAFYHGLTWWDAFAEKMPPGPRTDAVVASTRALLAEYPMLVDVVDTWDRGVWPKSPTLRYTAVAAIYPSGTVRWFLHNTVEGWLALADPTGPLPPEAAAGLESMQQLAREHRYAPVGGRPLTANFANVQVRRRPNATPFPEGALLIPHEYTEPGPAGRKIRYAAEGRFQ